MIIYENRRYNNYMGLAQARPNKHNLEIIDAVENLSPFKKKVVAAEYAIPQE